MALPEVDGLGRDQDPDLVRRKDRALAVSACATEAIRSAEAPASRRMTRAPMAISALCAGWGTEAGGSAPGPSISVANSTGPSGAGRTSRPFLAIVRHDDTWFAGSTCRRATPFTIAPGTSVSATIRAFSSSGHCRFRRLRPAAERTSNMVSMENLRPDYHTPPMRRSGRLLEGEVPRTLTIGSGARSPCDGHCADALGWLRESRHRRAKMQLGAVQKGIGHGDQCFEFAQPSRVLHGDAKRITPARRRTG